MGLADIGKRVGVGVLKLCTRMTIGAIELVRGQVQQRTEQGTYECEGCSYETAKEQFDTDDVGNLICPRCGSARVHFDR